MLQQNNHKYLHTDSITVEYVLAKITASDLQKEYLNMFEKFLTSDISPTTFKMYMYGLINFTLDASEREKLANTKPVSPDDMDTKQM